MARDEYEYQRALRLMLLEITHHRQHCDRAVLLNAVDAVRVRIDDDCLVGILTVNYRAERLGLGILLALGGQSDRGGEIGFGSGDYLLAVGAVDPNGRNALIAEDEVELLTLDHCV